MTRRKWAIAIAALLGAMLVLSVMGQGSHVLSANLYGDEVVSRDGAPDAASGDFNGLADAGEGMLCYYLEAQGIDAVTEAHVHQGKRGKDGRAVIALHMAVDDELCEPVEAGLLERITQDPNSYYVDLHTARYPRGALRGQLQG